MAPVSNASSRWVSRWSWLRPLPWLFAGGDAVSGPSSVVAAIGAGFALLMALAWRGREAAVFLSWLDYGPGIEGFHKQLPEVGQLYTPAQLKKLLTP